MRRSEPAVNPSAERGLDVNPRMGLQRHKHRLTRRARLPWSPPAGCSPEQIDLVAWCFAPPVWLYGDRYGNRKPILNRTFDRREDAAGVVRLQETGADSVRWHHEPELVGMSLGQRRKVGSCKDDAARRAPEGMAVRAYRIRLAVEPDGQQVWRREYRREAPRVFQCLAAILDRKSTRLNSSHSQQSRMPSSA